MAHSGLIKFKLIVKLIGKFRDPLKDFSVTLSNLIGFVSVKLVR